MKGFSFKQKVAALSAFLTGVALLVGFTPMPSANAAAASCNAATYTVNGVFDLNGYLACQAALANGLPATGSGSMQAVGIALGLLAIGIAAVYVSVRERRNRIA